MSLVPCKQCARHVRAEETACPFCGGALSPESNAAPPAALSRAALIFAGATALAACGKETAQPPPAPQPKDMTAVPAYGPPPDWNTLAPTPPDAGPPPPIDGGNKK